MNGHSSHSHQQTPGGSIPFELDQSIVAGAQVKIKIDFSQKQQKINFVNKNDYLFLFYCKFKCLQNVL